MCVCVSDLCFNVGKNQAKRWKKCITELCKDELSYRLLWDQRDTGVEISLHWRGGAGNDVWFPGSIIGYNTKEKKHIVDFNDGKERLYDLSRVFFRIEKLPDNRRDTAVYDVTEQDTHFMASNLEKKTSVSTLKACQSFHEVEIAAIETTPTGVASSTILLEETKTATSVLPAVNVIVQPPTLISIKYMPEFGSKHQHQSNEQFNCEQHEQLHHYGLKEGDSVVIEATCSHAKPIKKETSMSIHLNNGRSIVLDQSTEDTYVGIYIIQQGTESSNSTSEDTASLMALSIDIGTAQDETGTAVVIADDGKIIKNTNMQPSGIDKIVIATQEMKLKAIEYETNTDQSLVVNDEITITATCTMSFSTEIEEGTTMSIELNNQKTVRLQKAKEHTDGKVQMDFKHIYVGTYIVEKGDDVEELMANGYQTESAMDESGNTLKKDTVIQGIKEYQPSETITIDTQAKERAAAKTKADAAAAAETKRMADENAAKEAAAAALASQLSAKSAADAKRLEEEEKIRLEKAQEIARIAAEAEIARLLAEENKRIADEKAQAEIEQEEQDRLKIEAATVAAEAAAAEAIRLVEEERLARKAAENAAKVKAMAEQKATEDEDAAVAAFELVVKAAAEAKLAQEAQEMADQKAIEARKEHERVLAAANLKRIADKKAAAKVQSVQETKMIALARAANESVAETTARKKQIQMVLKEMLLGETYKWTFELSKPIVLNEHSYCTCSQTNNKRNGNKTQGELAHELHDGNQYVTVYSHTHKDQVFTCDTDLIVGSTIIPKSILIQVVQTRLSNKICFQPNTCIVVDQCKHICGMVAKLLTAHPDVRIRVDGHVKMKNKYRTDVDKMGQAERLSALRARSVVNEFIHFGIEANRMDHKGFGGSMPLPKGQDDKRVEISVLDL